MSRFYRMHDAKPCGMLAATPDSLEHWNRRGFGIFATVQRFQGPRQIENLAQIQAWAVDLDGGDKEQQRDRLQRSPLIPSSVVETKNGYHAYWYAADARADHYRAVVGRLVEFFRGDPNARDLARVLRVPGFYHLKDPAEPFLVKHAWGPHRDLVYRERQMAALFPPTADELKAREVAAAKPEPVPSKAEFPSSGTSIWERAFDLDAREALPRLSGHWSVGGEQYELKPQRSGKFNIWVGGKSTSCFVDANGKIGSADKGGPGIAQWIHWHQRDYRKVREALLEVFPEVEPQKETA
jgi:hypothetical protein